MKVKKNIRNLKYVITLFVLLSIAACYSKHIIEKGNVTKDMTSKEKMEIVEKTYSLKDKEQLDMNIFSVDDMFYFYRNMAFKKEDYIGVWRDPEHRDYDLSLNKTGFNKYFIKSNWGDGTCKAIKKTRNILLLECNGNFVPSGNFKDTIVREYIGFEIYYDFFSGLINTTVTFSPDKRCAIIGSASEKDNCSFHEEHVTGKYGVGVKFYNYYKLIHGEKPSFWEYD